MKFKNFKYILFFAFLSFCFIGCAPKSKDDKKEVEVLPSFKEELVEAGKEEARGNIILARKIYKDAFSQLTNPQDIESIKSRIEELNTKIIFSKAMDDKSLLYEVKEGDTLGEIATKFNTTIELIKKANGLSSDTIRVKDKLKVTQAKFSVVIDKSQNLLFLKRDDEVFKTYTVSTGKDNCTPVGTFKIITKVEKPVWFRKDVGIEVPAGSPDNILGSRWLGLDIQGYGIHGTNSPDTLGRQETQGCVRMRNEDVEEVFSILPRGSEVTIVD